MGLSLLVSLVSLEYGSMSSERGPLALFLILRWDFAIGFVGLFSFPFSIFLFLIYRWDLFDFAFVLVFYSLLLSHLEPISINLQSGDHRWLLALVPLPQVS